MEYKLCCVVVVSGCVVVTSGGAVDTSGCAGAEPVTVNRWTFERINEAIWCRKRERGGGGWREGGRKSFLVSVVVVDILQSQTTLDFVLLTALAVLEHLLWPKWPIMTHTAVSVPLHQLQLCRNDIFQTCILAIHSACLLLPSHFIFSTPLWRPACCYCFQQVQSRAASTQTYF